MATKKAAATKTNGRGRASMQAAPRARSSAPDALALLRSDHQEVTALFDRFKASKRASQKERLAQKICQALSIHAQIEEEIFYVALRYACAPEDAGDMLNEADVEHSGVRKLIAEIQASSSEDPHFEARIEVLSEYIRHHVKEEQRDLFKAARSSDLDLKMVGAQLAARKKELLRELR